MKNLFARLLCITPFLFATLMASAEDCSNLFAHEHTEEAIEATCGNEVFVCFSDDGTSRVTWTRLPGTSLWFAVDTEESVVQGCDPADSSGDGDGDGDDNGDGNDGGGNDGGGNDSGGNDGGNTGGNTGGGSGGGGGGGDPNCPGQHAMQ